MVPEGSAASATLRRPSPWCNVRMRDLNGRLVAITGGSRGIGAATALAVARQGGDVVLISRGHDALDDVARQVRDIGRQAWVVPVDLRHEAEAAEAARAVLRIATPDVVVANAGHSIARTVLGCVDRQDSYTRTMGVNFLGTVAFCGPLLTAMSVRGSGHLIGVTTATARIPLPGWGAYAASKAAFDAWLLAARPELADVGIDVTVCMPGLVKTDMLKPSPTRRRFVAQPEEVAKLLVRAMVRPRAEVAAWWVRPAEVVAAVAPHAVAKLLWSFTRQNP